ncbi:hypothetical protein [Terriglobus albidus]|uniref:hypothetical protein n=1 Tax=Terriglobus albidus TaxID=1592106 RepID=UPI0021DFDDCE|nr:hypothetical protein [Terriglobus albidus]
MGLNRSKLMPAMTLLLAMTICPGHVFSQAKETAKQVVPVPPAPTDDDLAVKRDQLLALLRMSPTLTQVLITDPTLLADDAYINRVNPELARFLAQHPEITRNPEFYLFAEFPEQRGRHTEPLRRRGNNNNQMNQLELRRQYMQNALQTLIFIGVVGSLLWLIHILLENRRWSRVFRLQSEIHNKLIERFATTDNLMQYMSTESGRRFLEAAPIPMGMDRQRMSGGLARVIASLQIGLVLSLLGLGLVLLRHSVQEFAAPLLVAGVVTMMPGIALLLSAAITWRVSSRLGLLSENQNDAQQDHI